MSDLPGLSSAQLALYMEQRGELAKPWMWHLLRQIKIRESLAEMGPEEVLNSVQEAHSDLMQLGEFWKGREEEVFGGRYAPGTVIEPLPGSAEDR